MMKKSVAAALFGAVVVALAGGSAMAQSYRSEGYAPSAYDRAQQYANDVKELNSDSGLAAHKELVGPRATADRGNNDSQFIGQYNR